ncbi:MAG: hypothetical protein RLZZ618_2805 [Pseudomonadota bacterium]|jgi:uncharacterized protein YcbX
MSDLAGTPVGTVEALWRYPVKSMRGEAVTSSWADERGLLGDRAWAVVDSVTGKVGSAKHPKLWSRLFECQAQFVQDPEPGQPLPPVRIELPGGIVFMSDDPQASSLLSEFLGRPVHLASQAQPQATYDDYWPDIENLSPEGHRDTMTQEAVSRFAPAGTFFDMSAFHVVTDTSLQALRDAAPGSQIDATRFRPNITVRSPVADGTASFVENDWPGRTLRVGPALAMRMLMPTMRCIMVTMAQPHLPSDPQILKALVKANRVDIPEAGKFPCIGVYGSLSRKLSAGGVVKVGDACLLG